MSWKRISECYQCGKSGCVQATDNPRQFYCHRFQKTYYMNSGDLSDLKEFRRFKKVISGSKEKKSDKSQSTMFSFFREEDSNHYDDEI